MNDIRMAGGATEQNIVVGNYFDKYGSRNPIVKRLMQGFHDDLQALVQLAAPADIHEVGCGEGYWVLRWTREGRQARGSDFSETVVGIAKANARQLNVDDDIFGQRSIYDLTPDMDGADLVVCCEVLEHLEHPGLAVQVLKRLVKRNLIVSVPREPIWRILNMARGKYWRALGNTPGHLQHWSRSGILGLLAEHFEIVEVRTPLPWTMVLCRARP